MIRFTTHIDIDRPTDEVFDFVADFENIPKWNYFVTRVDKLTAGPVTVGTRFHQVRQTDEQDYDVTRLVPGRLVEVTTTPQSTPSLTMRFDIEAVPGGSRLTDSWQLDTARSRPLELLGTPRVRSAISQNLAKLKHLLETGAATLQDGRVVTLA